MDNLILYHGSRALFERFDFSYLGSDPGGGSSRLGIGMYWTSKKEKALNAYANMTENLSENISFRKTPFKCVVLYRTHLAENEQKKILNLLNITDDILLNLEKTADKRETKAEIQKMLNQKNRYPDFAIWARKHQDLIKKVGFNCVQEKNIFCFFEPEKLKWDITEAKVLSGTEIARSLISEDTKIIIQDKLNSDKSLKPSIQIKTVLGRDLLAESKAEKICVSMPKTSLKMRLQQMVCGFLKKKEFSKPCKLYPKKSDGR